MAMVSMPNDKSAVIFNEFFLSTQLSKADSWYPKMRPSKTNKKAGRDTTRETTNEHVESSEMLPKSFGWFPYKMYVPI